MHLKNLSPPALKCDLHLRFQNIPRMIVTNVLIARKETAEFNPTVMFLPTSMILSVRQSRMPLPSPD
jgi:hypothetical protein